MAEIRIQKFKSNRQNGQTLTRDFYLKTASLQYMAKVKKREMDAVSGNIIFLYWHSTNAVYEEGLFVR